MNVWYSTQPAVVELTLGRSTNSLVGAGYLYNLTTSGNHKLNSFAKFQNHIGFIVSCNLSYFRWLCTNSSKKVMAPPKYNEMLPNIANLPSENNKAEDEEIQSLSLPQSQKINIEIEVPWIDILFVDVENNLTVKEIFKTQDFYNDLNIIQAMNETHKISKAGIKKSTLVGYKQVVRL